MGLDSYFVNDEGEVVGDFVLSTPLCGGLFSGDGSNGSFRGKCYDALVRYALAHQTSDEASSEVLTLYEQEMSNEQVCRIASALNRFVEEHRGEECCGVPYHQAKSLAELFTQACERGCRYIGWW